MQELIDAINRLALSGLDPRPDLAIPAASCTREQLADGLEEVVKSDPELLRALALAVADAVLELG